MQLQLQLYSFIQSITVGRSSCHIGRCVRSLAVLNLCSPCCIRVTSSLSVYTTRQQQEATSEIGIFIKKNKKIWVSHHFKCFTGGVWVMNRKPMWWMSTCVKISNQTVTGEGEIITRRCKWLITVEPCQCSRLWGKPCNSCQMFKGGRLFKKLQDLSPTGSLLKLKNPPVVFGAVERFVIPVRRKPKSRFENISEKREDQR